ncbi:MAG: hypothetical protein IKQ72_01365 [Bacteroidaceae bacterium]|nr:hypothetical protein [Bacteroidaceae bacterium]
MKRFLLIALSFVPLFSMAQDDDMYFVSRKQAAKNADKKLYDSFRKDPDRQYSVYGNSSVSDDDYNRRGVLSNAKYQTSGGSDMDTLFVTSDSVRLAGTTDSLVHKSKKVKIYSDIDDLEDYYYSRRMARLHRFAHSPYYWDLYCGSYWYDPWYDPWFYHHGWGWYNSWYDPYFYGYSWYGWNYWYDGWYAGYGPHYWRYHHHYHDYYYGGGYYPGHVVTNSPNFHYRSSGVNSGSRGSQAYAGIRGRGGAASNGIREGGRGTSAASRYGYNRNGTSASSSNVRSTSSRNSNSNYYDSHSVSSRTQSTNYSRSSSTSNSVNTTRSSSSSSSSRSYSSGRSYSGGGSRGGGSYSGGGSRGGGGGGARRR